MEMLNEYPNEHAGNIPVTFVTQKRFAVLFFLRPVAQAQLARTSCLKFRSFRSKSPII